MRLEKLGKVSVKSIVRFASGAEAVVMAHSGLVGTTVDLGEAGTRCVHNDAQVEVIDRWTSRRARAVKEILGGLGKVVAAETDSESSLHMEQGLDALRSPLD